MNISRKDAKKIAAIFIIYKILVLTVAYGSYALIPEDLTKRKHSDTPWLDPFAQLDARAYLDIAKNGYNAEFNGTTNYGWYPLYPLLIKTFSFIGYELAAFLIANVFSFTAILLLYVLVKGEFNEKIAKKSIFYALFFPAAFFLTVMYTESLFLTLVLAMFLFARESKWHYTGILGFFAALARPQGIIMLVPMAYMYWRKEKKISAAAFALLLIPLGTMSLMVYHYSITGDPLIQFSTQSAYQRGLSLLGPFNALMLTIREITTEPALLDVLVGVFNISIALLLTGLLYLSRNKIKPEYIIYFVLSLAVPLFSSSLASISRFGLVMFPTFMTLAVLSEKKEYRRLIMLMYVLFLAAMIFGLVRYANEDLLIL